MNPEINYKKEVYKLLKTLNDVKIYKFLYDFLITVRENW